MTYTFLQNYWWVLVSLLGGLLVALMFVQGANIQLVNPRLDRMRKPVTPSRLPFLFWNSYETAWKTKVTSRSTHTQ